MPRLNVPRAVSATAVDLDQIQQPVAADLIAVDRFIEARLQSEVALVNQVDVTGNIKQEKKQP